MRVGYTSLVPVTRPGIHLAAPALSHFLTEHLAPWYTKRGSFRHSIDCSTKGLGAVKFGVPRLLSKRAMAVVPSS